MDSKLPTEETTSEESQSSNRSERQTKQSGRTQSEITSNPTQIVEASSARSTRQREREQTSSARSTRQREREQAPSARSTRHTEREQAPSARSTRHRERKRASPARSTRHRGRERASPARSTRQTEREEASPARSTQLEHSAEISPECSVPPGQSSLSVLPSPGNVRSEEQKSFVQSELSVVSELQKSFKCLELITDSQVSSSDPNRPERSGIVSASSDLLLLDDPSQPGPSGIQSASSDLLMLDDPSQPGRSGIQSARSDILMLDDPSQPGPSGLQLASSSNLIRDEETFSEESDETGLASRRAVVSLRPASFRDLNFYMRREVLQYLSLRDLMACCRVSRTWNEMINTEVPWLKLCLDHGLARRVAIARGPRNFLLSMTRRVAQMRRSDCFRNREWVRIPVEASENVSYAFHYRNRMCVEVIAYGIIRITVFETPRRICVLDISENMESNIKHLKLTFLPSNNCIIVVTYQGSVSVWRIDGPLVRTFPGEAKRLDPEKALKFKGNLGEIVYSFDLLDDTLIGAFGLQGRVKIWNIAGSSFIDVGTSPKEEVLKVVLTRHWSEDSTLEIPMSQPHNKSFDLLLFSMVRRNVYVQRVSFRPSGPEGSSNSVTQLYLLNLWPPQYTIGNYDTCKPTLCYDGVKYLYFPRESPYSKTVVQFDVRTGCREEFKFNKRVDNLLGAGKMTLLCIMTNEAEKKSFLVAVGTRYFQKRFQRELIGFDSFDEINPNEYHECAFIAEKSWLNGIDGQNDSGLVCSHVSSSRLVRRVYWR